MFKIALRNMLRNKRRTALTGLSIALAVMMAIYIWSFISGVIDSSFENQVRLISGHVRILNADYLKREKMLPLEANIANYQAVENLVKIYPAVTLAAGRIKFGVLLEHKGKNKPVVGVGINPLKEEKISHLSQKIIKGRKIRPGAAEINIGAKLARELGLKPGDTLTVVTQTAYGSLAAMNLRIAGLFSYGVPSVDRTTFYLPLSKAQELLDLEGKVTEIFVLLKNMAEAPGVAAEIGADLARAAPGEFAVRSWQDQGIIYFWMRIAKRIYGAIYFSILFLASFTILNTMFMSVLERTREIGMMKALGMKNRQVMGVILLEALLIGVIASFIGALGGAGIAYYLAVAGIDFSATFEAMKGTFNFPAPYVYRALFSWGIVFFGFCLGVLFSVLAAVPPAWRAAQLEPGEALREI